MTALEKLMQIVESQGGSGNPETLVEGLELLAAAIGEGVTPEAIAGAVADWLDEHPEATTTVADDSVSLRKLTGYRLLSVSDIEDLF